MASAASFLSSCSLLNSPNPVTIQFSSVSSQFLVIPTQIPFLTKLILGLSIMTGATVSTASLIKYRSDVICSFVNPSFLYRPSIICLIPNPPVFFFFKFPNVPFEKTTSPKTGFIKVIELSFSITSAISLNDFKISFFILPYPLKSLR